MAGAYDDATCAGWPLAPLAAPPPPASSDAPVGPARDDADAAPPPPFVASVGAADAAAVGRERRLLFAGLRELEGRAPVPGVPLLAPPPPPA